MSARLSFILKIFLLFYDFNSSKFFFHYFIVVYYNKTSYLNFPCLSQVFFIVKNLFHCIFVFFLNHLDVITLLKIDLYQIIRYKFETGIKPLTQFYSQQHTFNFVDVIVSEEFGRRKNLSLSSPKILRIIPTDASTQKVDAFSKSSP